MTDLSAFEALLEARSVEIERLARAGPAALREELQRGEDILKQIEALKCDLERLAAYLRSLAESPDPAIDLRG